MGDGAIVTFCRARESLRREKDRTQAARSENVEARRVLGEMLVESMQEHNVECICVPGPSGDAYVRMLPQRARPPPPVHTEAEALALLDGVEDEVKNLPAAAIPDAVARHVTMRMRANARPPAPPRVAVVATPVRANTVRLTTVPLPVRSMTEQFVHKHNDARATRSALKPLRDAERSAEEQALGALTAPRAVRMTTSDATVTLRVARCERRSAPKPKPLGVRVLAEMCRDAARIACETQEVFVERLREHVGQRVREHLTDVRAPKPYLRVLRNHESHV